ncbi:hypothetical protein [Mongoliibacter ruber]|uniref:Uncharacterized protein n=1 Tax=Mongoliibacter ruber TaxID=1750599 RepID=A0A2T0WV48_9BACT|nr:hypothetical protein [Mongoliibacter ruber]PRY90557.1 hypothetical protein CLW00_101219 [Mongoliibacter ruber]
MPSLKSPLPAIHPVRDVLKVIFETSGLPADLPAEIECILEVERTFGEADWEAVAEYLNPFDQTTEEAAVVINRALIGALKATPPHPSVSGVQPIANSILQYRLRYRLVIDGEGAESYTTSSTALAWLAGSSYLDNGIDLTGKAYLFQTTKPLSRHYSQNEKILLSILPLSTGTATLAATINFTDGTDQAGNVALGALTANRPVAIYYGIPAVAKTIANIEFTITGLTGTAEKLTYKLISRPAKAQLIYANSLGGFDTLALLGKNESNHTDDGQVFEGQLLDPTAFDEGNFESFNQSSSDSFVLRSGFMGLKEREALKDLTLRNQAYLMDALDLRKLVIENASYQLAKDRDFFYSLTISARFAHINHALSRS